MDYEKKYKEALRLAASYYGTGANEFLDTIFPELAESEDERVRRELIEYLRGDLDDITTDDTDRWIAYLEKQKDYFLVPKSHFDPVGKPGDDGMKILEKQKELDKMIVVSPEVWDNAISDAYENGKKDGEKQKELHYADKRVDDIMNMPELSAFEQALTNFIGYWEDDEEHWPSQFVKKHGKHILDMAKEELQKEQKPAWSEEDKEMLDAMIDMVSNSLYEPLCPREGMLAWLKSLRPQPKEEWSERDKKILNEIITIMDGGKVTSGTYLFEYAAFLKSLRPSWKPSEEQIRCLEMVLSSEAMDDNVHDVLTDLYEQLKKL